MGDVTSGRGSTAPVEVGRRRPRAVGSGRDLPGVVVPVVLGLVLGLAGGFAPGWTLVVLGGGAVLLVVLWRVELAALALVAGSVVQDQLADVASAALPGDPGVSGSTVSALLVAVLLASWVLHRVRTGPRPRPRSRVVDAALVLLLVLLVATAVHPRGLDGLAVVLRQAGWVAVTLVLLDALRGPLRARLAAQVYVGAAAAVSVAGLVALLLGAEARVTGPAGDPDGLALLLVAALPLALVLRRDSRLTWPSDAAVVLLVLAIGGTASRGALLALAVVLAVALATRLLSAVAVASVVAVLLIGTAVAAVATPDLLRTALGQDDAPVATRVDRSVEPSEVTVQHPLLGLGPGWLAPGGHDRHASTDDAPDPFDVEHGTWLQAAAETGLLGLVALLGVWLAGLRAAWTRWRRDGDPLAAGVCAAYVATLVAATSVPAQLLLPLWLLTALGAALGAEGTTAPTGPPGRRT